MGASIWDTFGWMLDHLGWSAFIAAAVVLTVVSLFPVAGRPEK